MTTRPAPKATTTSTVYRLRLDNLLLALVVCGLIAAAVPIVFARVHHSTQAKPLPMQAMTSPAAQTLPTTTATSLTPAQAVASANALLAHGQFAEAMKLVENLSGPDADAAGASGMRDRISSAQTTFNADISAIQTGAANGDWAGVIAAAREARTLAPLPADAEALAKRASAELTHSAAVNAAQAAFDDHRYPDALQMARDGFARWKTTDFRDLMVRSLAGIAATSNTSTTPSPAAGSTPAAHQVNTAVAPHPGGGATAAAHTAHVGGGGATTAHGTITHAHHSGAAAAQPAMTITSTSQATPAGAPTADALATDPAFAGIDPQLLADALRMLGPDGLAQLQAAGMDLSQLPGANP